MRKLKERIMYKTTVTYFTKTNRSHEISIAYTHNNRLGCSHNSAQGVRRFTAIATTQEIETWKKKIENNKPLIRSMKTWVYDESRKKEVAITTYLPNRHQRKHGITSNGFQK